MSSGPARWLCWLAVALLLGAAPALAGDASDLRRAQRSLSSDLATVRGHRLENRLSGIRTRLRDEPGRASYELDQARRRLHQLQLEAPRDPRLFRLERDIDRLQADADRIERRRDLERSLERLEAGTATLAPPAYARPPLAPDIRGQELPIGTAKRYMFVRDALRDAKAKLAADDRDAAADHLDAAREGLTVLKAGELADDPNVVATEREVADLEARLASGG